MKILITGGGGLLGQYLNFTLSKSFRILTTFHNDPGNCIDYNSIQLDITNRKNIGSVINLYRPEIVIHAAAIADTLTQGSLDSRFVYETNVTATKNISEFCDKFSAKLIYISSDLVYAGYRGSMLKEGAKLIPASLYAETKLMAEVKIRETFDNFLILRSALLYGFGIGRKKNHFQQMYDNFRINKPVKLFYDQYRTPLSFFEAGRIINELTGSDVKGEIINLGGKERVSRLDIGNILCDLAGFDKNLIEKISMQDIPDYPVVEDVSMDTSKLQSYGIKQKSIGDSIKEIINS
jgi:dTDP-4-dehydrorhamnose reductase